MIISKPGGQISVALILLCLVKDAYAYIDPGTGSLLVQGLLAAIAGTMVALKFYWHRILTFFGLRKDNPDSNQRDNEEE